MVTKRKQRKGTRAPEVAKINVDSVNKLAYCITRTLADFHEHGRVVRNDSGEITGVTAGTGVALTRDDRAELFESARAELLAGLMRGKPLSGEAWRNAANTARRSLYQVTKTRAMFDLEVLEMDAHEKEHANRIQPGASDFLFAPDEESRLSERKCVLRMYRNAKRALARHWSSKSYPRARMDARRDFQALRRITLALINGGNMARSKRENEASYQRNLDLARRVASGRELQEQDHATRKARKFVASAKLALMETQTIHAMQARGEIKSFAHIPARKFTVPYLVALPDSPARFTVTRTHGKLIAQLVAA